MRKDFNRFYIGIVLLLVVVIFQGCGKIEKSVVDAPNEVINMANAALDKIAAEYGEEPFSVSFTEKNITELVLADRIDVTYEAMKAELSGAPVGKDVYIDVYSFQYALAQSPGFGQSEELRYDEDHCVTGRKGEEPRYLLVYNCDGEFTELYDNLRNAKELSEEWRTAVSNSIFELPDINYDFWRAVPEYSFLCSGKTVSLGESISEIPQEYGITVKSESYKLFNSADLFTPIRYMSTSVTGTPKTYRGIGVGDTLQTLKQVYPVDLYQIPHLKEYDGGACDFAYGYMPEDGTYRDIMFYIKNNHVVFIEMGCGVVDRRFEKPYEKIITKESKFQVDTFLEHEQKIELDYPGNTGDKYTCKVSFKLPKVKIDVPNSEKINDNIPLEEYTKYVDKLKAGDYNELILRNTKEYKVNYHVYKYGKMNALVIETKFSQVDAGEDLTYDMWYYDSEKGQVISAGEYAKGCELQEMKITGEYNKNTEDKAVSVYQVPFYVDFGGKLHILYPHAT